MALAATGILLCLVLGGWAFAQRLRERQLVDQYRSEIAAVAAEFGDALVAGDYGRAYQLTDVNFQRQVPPDDFVSVFVNEQSRLGGLRGATSNNLARITFFEDGPPTAEAVLIVESGRSEPLRQTVRLVRREEGWRFFEFPAWFQR
jgi:hypothetical protein